jgi:lactoylglutathione lyase
MMSTRIDMIGIFPENLVGMVAFYRDVLGFAIEWDGQGPYAEFQNDGVRFAMYDRKQLPGLFSGQTPTFPTGMNGTFELAIELPTSADVDREFSRVVAAGARTVYAPRDEPWGMRSSMIMDPEGNLIEIGSWNKVA